MSFIVTLLFGVVAIFASVYLFFQYRYMYWMKKNIFFNPPKFPYGNFQGIQKEFSFAEITRKIYLSNKGRKAVGTWVFAAPTLIVRDLQLIRSILIKDFNSFMDRGLIQADKYDPLTGHLFFLKGKKWRNIRIKLTPTFTSGKMKMMFPTLVKCGENFKNNLEKIAENEGTVEVKGFVSNYTMDVIASCAFGLEINAFENPNSEFKRTSDFFFHPTAFQAWINTLSFTAPRILEFFKLSNIPKNVTKFFIGVIDDAFNYREKNNVKRNDFVQLLLELKTKGRIEDSEVYKHGEIEAEDDEFDPTFTVNQAAAQAFVFFVAGFETSSTVMMFCLYELALNQDIQDKVREEMDRVVAKHKGELTYESLQEMEYLEQVVSETLRKYPPAPQLIRECTKHIFVPELNSVLEKGTRIIVPTLGIMNDPEYYPNPEKFDPERFSPENKQNRDPMTFLPFGDGPRICIGMRFAQMQTKAGLTILLRNFKVYVSEKTPTKLKYDPKVILTAIVGGMHLKIKKRDL